MVRRSAVKWIHSDLKKWSDVIHFEIQACLYMVLVIIWASLVAQMVKNPPAMWETWVWSPGWVDPLEEGMATTPVFLPGESHGQRNLAGCSPWGHKEVGHDWMTERLSTAQQVQVSHHIEYVFLQSQLNSQKCDCSFASVF